LTKITPIQTGKIIKTLGFMLFRVVIFFAENWRKSPNIVTNRRLLAQIAEYCHKSPTFGTNRQILSQIADFCHKSPNIGTNRRLLAQIAEYCHKSPKTVIITFTPGEKVQQQSVRFS
jgi:hypothetical protein